MSTDSRTVKTRFGQRVYHPDGRPGQFTLIECPACGADLPGGPGNASHIESHSPEDFGLSPMGERQ